MDGSVVGPAQQGQIGQVGGAAMEPVPQVVGVAPGQGPFTVGEDTAPSRTARAARWAGLDDPGGPADLQRLGRGPTQDSGAAGSWRPGAGPPAHPAFSDHGSWVVPGRSGPGFGMVPGRWGRGRGRGRGGGGWGAGG